MPALALFLAALLLKLKQPLVPHAQARSLRAAPGVVAAVASLVTLMQKHLAHGQLNQPAPQSKIARVVPMEETSLLHIAR